MFKFSKENSDELYRKLKHLDALVVHRKHILYLTRRIVFMHRDRNVMLLNNKDELVPMIPAKELKETRKDLRDIYRWYIHLVQDTQRWYPELKFKHKPVWCEGAPIQRTCGMGEPRRYWEDSKGNCVFPKEYAPNLCAGNFRLSNVRIRIISTRRRALIRMKEYPNEPMWICNSLAEIRSMCAGLLP